MIPDECDISDGTSSDCNLNGIPSECEADCCSDTSDCADLNGDGLRDDGCMWWACEAGACVPTAVPYGDMGGQFGLCAPDGTADNNDRNHALNCFANTDTDQNPLSYPCEPHGGYPPGALNVDTGGQFGSCVPDGVCDGNDAFAALNAFDNTTNCSCPLDGGPSPEFEPFVVDDAVLALATKRPVVAPGALVAVDVVLISPLTDLRGYQLHLGVSGGDSGQLELVDILIDRDALFVEFGAWRAMNIATQQLVTGLDTAGIATPADTYLATFVYRASRGAHGTFAIEILDDVDPAHRTYLFPTVADGRIVTTSHGTAVEVGAHGR